MDRNLLLAFALSFAVLTLWQMWQPPVPPRDDVEIARELPAHRQFPSEEAPSTAPVEVAVGGAADQGDSGPKYGEADAEEEIFSVERDQYSLEISSVGAGVRSWQLAEYQQKNGDPLELPTGQVPRDVALLTPFRELGIGDLSKAGFHLEAQDDVSYTFRLEREGVVVRKTLTFPRTGYAYTLRLEIENRAPAEVTSEFGVSWPSHVNDQLDFKEQSLAVLHNGSVETESVNAIGKGGYFSSAEPVKVFTGEVEWIAAQGNYFASVLVPDDPGRAVAKFVAEEPGVSATSELSFRPVEIPPGQTVGREFHGYVGPKIPDLLEEFGHNAILTIDFGWSWVSPMTRFFGWMLHSIHSFIPNYGVAIIILTILVRVVTAPLTTKQMRSMERMRTLQPQLKEIQEKFKGDKPKQSEKTMELYRKEKVNPLGGCLPMVLQLPVFIGLFYALRSSIDLRQAPFFGWINDLSAPEEMFSIPGMELPVRVLPLIMGATMVLQQRMTPMPSADPAQAKMMMIVMPIMMTVLFYQFPSGLVLYWMVSNVLAISHQRWIGRKIKSPAN